MMEINKLLAIQNYGPSGTLFIQSLLDGHPDILSLPALHGQQLLIFWERYSHLALNDLLNIFLVDHCYWFEPEKNFTDYGLERMGPHENEKVIIDKNQFTQALLQQWGTALTLTRKQFLISVYLAYNECIGRPTHANMWLLYPIHSLPQAYALQLTEDFTNVKFLHMVRNPIQSIGSLAKHINRNHDWLKLYLLECVLSQIVDDFTIHAGPHPAHGLIPYFNQTDNALKQSYAVKLEDVHTQSRTILQAICHWLNIAWSDTLLASTFDSKQWHNRAESVKQSGIGLKTVSQQHSDILSSFDKIRLQMLCSPILTAFHYANKMPKAFFVKLLPLLLLYPFKMEMMLARYKKQYALYYSETKSSKKHLIKSRAFYATVSALLKSYIRSRQLMFRIIHQQHRLGAKTIITLLSDANLGMTS